MDAFLLCGGERRGFGHLEFILDQTALLGLLSKLNAYFCCFGLKVGFGHTW